MTTGEEEAFPWRGRRVLVTGCTEFLGGAVARELSARGAEIVGLVHDRPASDFFHSELGRRIHFIHGRADNVFRLHSALAVHEIAAVFHLATEETGSSERGTNALLQAAKLYARRIPLVSAELIPHLGITRGEVVKESDLSIARFGEVFGPGDRNLSRIVPRALAGIISGSPAVANDGPARDFVYVGDAARACIRVAEASVTSGAIECAFRSGWVMTDRQIVAALRATHNDRPFPIPDTASSVQPLGWQPRYSLPNALNETLVWYRSFVRTGSSNPLPVAA
jgi:CDP-glucose 4,6-dehydratase